VQSKKLKSEERLKTLQLLARLAPSQSTSAALASTSTLGQNPLRPSSAKERVERREDRLVRRGIEKVSKSIGDAKRESEDGSSGSESDRRGRRYSKGKERAVDVTDEAEEEGVKTSVLPSRVNGDPNGYEPKKSRQPRKVSFV